MKNGTRTVRRTASSLLLSLLVLSMSACGGDSPESMLTSAKDYLAKNDAKAAVIQLKNALQNKPDLAEARFLLGKALIEEGNFSGADVELRKAADLKFSADQLIPVQARVMLVLGKPEKVIDDFGKAQLSTPESRADLQATLGNAYLALGKADDAKRAFDTALSSVPDYGAAIFGLARIRVVGRDMEGALALLDSAIAKDPKFLEALQLKGDVLAFQGKSGEAQEIYRSELGIRSDYLPAYVALISRLMEAGKLDEAGKQFESMKKIAPTNLQTLYVQAELSYRQKKFPEARDAIQQYLRAVPDSVVGQQLAGAIEFELKSYSTAEKYLRALLTKTPELGISRQILIASYLRSGQPDKALATLDPILSKIDNNSTLLALAGEVFMQNGDETRAAAYFSKAAALDPGNAGKQTAVALTRLAMGETETAYRELEKIASTDSGTRADLALIASQLRNRKFDQALKSIDVLEKKQPEDPLADNLRGLALLGKGKQADARKSFEKALQKNPAFVPAAANLARLDLADKKPDEAKKRFESVLAKDATNTQAMLALAELQARSGGKPEEVLTLINKAVAAKPTDVQSRLALINFYLNTKEPKKAAVAAQEAQGAIPDNPALLDAEGRALQVAGDYNQALSVYGRLASLLPNAVQPYLRMAEIHLAAKDKEAAMQNLRKAMSIKPDSIEAQRATMMLDLDAGRISEAIATARNVQKQDPKSPAGYLLEGDAYAVSKSWKEAMVAYRNGIKQTGAKELAIRLYAALSAQNQAGEADKFADSWLKDHPDDQAFRLYLAESAIGRKDYPVAIRHYGALLDSQPNNPALMNNLAWALGQNKDPKAIELAEKAYQLAPDQPGVIDTLGSMLVDKGEFERGLELLRKAHSLAPNNPAITLNFAKALIKADKGAEARPILDSLVALGDRFAGSAEAGELLKNLK